jgi:SAM-dependent methyltransferase
MIFKSTMAKADLERHLAGVHFYHTFAFTNGCLVPGDWDVARSLEQYKFPSPLPGKEVLDVGPGSGFFSFYFESLGANVTTLETRGYGDFDVYGNYQYTGNEGRPADRIQNGDPIWFGPVSPSFWKIYDAIGSKVTWKNGRIYDLTPELMGRTFDLIFVGSLLLHLRDPIGALRAARSVCRDTLVATIPTWLEHDEEDVPIQMLPYTHLDRISWWMPNKAALRHWFLAAGFRQVELVGTLTLHSNRDKDNPQKLSSIIVEQVVHARI